LCVTSAPIRAQEPRPVEAGARVRVTLVSTKQRVRGTFVGRVGDSIDVQTTSPEAGAPMRIALQGIYAMSLGLGGLLTGAVVGAIGHDAWTPASLSGWHPIVGVRRSGFTIGFTSQLRR
ncbi:MAG TPA: hypothetical protein VF234_07815, partial [Limnochordia bacterium]